MQIPEDFFRWLVIFFVRPQQQSKPLFVSRLIDKEKIGKAVARIALAVAFSILPVSLSSADQPREQDFNIPQQSVKSALNSLATQANVFLLFPYDQVIEVNANPVVGVYSIQQALDLLLKNTGLNGDLTQGGVLAISRAGTNASATANNGKGKSMNTSKRKNVLATMVGLFATAGGVGSALAQGDEAATAQGRIDEIIVTASRREENIRSVPSSISVISGSHLEGNAATNFEDYLKLSPGVQLNKGEGQASTVSIRGITTSPLDFVATQQPVGIYFGETPLTDPPGGSIGIPDIGPFDLERIEILRGPQGSLYGSASLGGAIRYIPNQPDFSKMSARLSTTISSIEQGGINHQVNAMVNTPVSESLAFRGSVSYVDDNGYVDNRFAGNNEEDANNWTNLTARAAMLWQPSTSLAVNATILHQLADYNGSSGVTGNLEELAQSAVDRTLKKEYNLANLTINYDLNFASLISTTSYVEKTNNENFLSGAFRIIPAIDSETFTQELRLVSSEDRQLTWLVGALYQAVDFSRLSDITVFSIPLSFTSTGGLESTEKAIYGEVSYRFNDRWELTAGGRHFWADNENVPSGRSVIDKKFTPKVTLSYQPSDEILLYGLYSEGFRLGGNNRDALMVAPYKSDKLQNTELGFKSAWLDGAVKIDATLFHIDWTNMQVEGQDLATALRFTQNAGKASSTGLELVVAVRPSESFELASALAWTEAELSEDSIPLQNQSTGAFQIAPKGTPLPTTPQWQFSNVLTYHISLGDDWISKMTFSHHYYGSSTNDLVIQAEQGNYNAFDLSLGVERESIQASLFITNLTDKRGVSQETPNLNGIEQKFLIRPRTIGLTLSKDF